MTGVARKQLAGPVAWAAAFGSVSALAMLWIGTGHNLMGELALALGRLPRWLLISAGGPDADRSPELYPLLSGGFTFLIAFGFLAGSSLLKREDHTAGRWALGGLVVAALLVLEIWHLLVGDIPRHVLGGLRFSLFLPWHVAAVVLTAGYVLWLRRNPRPWLTRSYWLVMFALSLAVLFPMTDSF